MRVGVLVPIGFALGAILSRAWLRYAPARIAIDRAQPLVVVTYWHTFGAVMFAALLLAIVVASAGYVLVLLRASPRRPLTAFAARGPSTKPVLSIVEGLRSARDDNSAAARDDNRWIMLLCAVACLAALAFPVVFSSDVYAYAGYGFMALHGLNPYAHVHLSVHNALMNAVYWQWSNPPPVCVYGPVFVWFSAAIVALFGSLGPAAPLWALRIISCAALVACVPLAYGAFAKFSPRTRLAASAGIALNPIAIWSCAEGHNDVLMLALVLGGFALAMRRPFAGALLLGLSPLVKVPSLIAAAVLAASSWKNRRVFAPIAMGAAIGVVVALILCRPMLTALRAESHGGHYAPQYSLQSIIASAISPPAAIAITIAAATALLVYGALRLRRGDSAGYIFAAFAGWLAIPNPYPWYALWILPLAFLAWETPIAWATLTLTLTVAFRYYAEATAPRLSPEMPAAIVAAQLGIPLCVFIARSMFWRSAHPENHRPVPDLALSRYP